jgi:hypothetical protein
MFMKIIYFIGFFLLFIIIYQILNYKEGVETYTPPDSTDPTDSPDSTDPTDSTDPPAKLVKLSKNKNDRINKELSTIKKRLNNMFLKQKQLSSKLNTLSSNQQPSVAGQPTSVEEQKQSQITIDGIKYVASTQPTPSDIKPLFDGILSGDLKDYKYKKCWSYGIIDNGLNNSILEGGHVYPNVNSMSDCVGIAHKNNYDTAAYNGNSLCTIGGREYTNYTQSECSPDIYGKKAWQVYSKV